MTPLALYLLGVAACAALALAAGLIERSLGRVR